MPTYNNIMAYITANPYKDITLYSQNKEHFFRYVVFFDEAENTLKVKKYILLTAEQLAETEVEFNCLMSVYDSVVFPSYFSDIFEEELIYYSLVGMINFVIEGIKENRINPQEDSVQELINLYPEAFI